MDARQQRVKHPHLMTRARERFDDVGSDKAGTAGNQDTHGPRLCTFTAGQPGGTARFIIRFVRTLISLPAPAVPDAM